MVYLSEQAKQRNQQDVEIPFLLDPILLRAAKQIYRTYFALHSKVTKRPLGVAIDKETHRGQLIFTRTILLPGECFVSLKQLESEMY